ncbi:hypothetical protein FHT44_005136 [Mycolicibacterium sp. BK634]|uniref:putative Ig domain-containing protein n=1 Tax=Mycolicibacterium sp. BK634 TaxID=2587099 RepID=UPI001607EFEC|nr:putative Ig domain-containing protein [Mycolicibacterium sp. BK634]MBB3752624.1 hypothetical protein [Mycolicibacterium sp. BK634]
MPTLPEDLTYFTVTRTIYSASPLVADVRFNALVSRDVIIAELPEGLREILLEPVYGKIVDGVLKSQDESEVGVQLLSAAEISIYGELRWQATFFNSSDTYLSPLIFPALPGEGTFDLKDAAVATTGIPGVVTGPRGYSFGGLQATEDGEHIQGLMSTPAGPIPVGDPVPMLPGSEGPPNVLDIGTVEAGDDFNDADANITGESPSQQLNLKLPRGFGFAGLTPAGDGTYVQGLVESPTGPVPVGDPVGVSIAYNSTVTHGTDPDVDRPPVSVAVIWIGSVEPNQALAGDVWWDTSGVAPTITTTSLNGMNKDAVFNQMLYADGTIPVQWTKLTGALPTGVSLSSLGNLSGTPTATGSFTFQLEARNPFGADTHSYSVTVGSAIAPTVLTADLGSFTAGVAYALQMSSSGSTPITYDTTSGAFPTGITMNSSGLISGTPASTGSGTVTIRATNVVGTNSHTFSWTVSGTAPTIIDTSLGAMWRGFAFSKTLSASGSTPITYSKVSGSYPSGVTMNSSGVFSGTPDTVQSYSFVVKATNAYGDSANVTFADSVFESTPVVAESTLGSMSVGVAFSKQLTLTSGGPTITWTQSGTLPAGITWDAATHTLSGTPTTAGSGTLTIRASNGTEYDDQVFSWTVVGLQYENTWSATGTSSPLTISTNASAHAQGILFVAITGNVASPSATATYNGVSMDTHGAVVDCGTYNTSYRTRIAVFKMADLAGGAKNVVVTPGAGVTGISAYFISVTGVGTVGDLQPKTYTTGTSLSQTVTSATGRIVLQCFYNPLAATITAYNKTEIAQLGTNRSLVGRTDGASSISFTATGGGSGYGAAALDLAA